MQPVIMETDNMQSSQLPSWPVAQLSICSVWCRRCNVCQIYTNSNCQASCWLLELSLVVGECGCFMKIGPKTCFGPGQ